MRKANEKNAKNVTKRGQVLRPSKITNYLKFSTQNNNSKEDSKSDHATIYEYNSR